MNNEEAYAIGARALAAGFKWMPGCLAVSTREKYTGSVYICLDFGSEPMFVGQYPNADTVAYKGMAPDVRDVGVVAHMLEQLRDRAGSSFHLWLDVVKDGWEVRTNTPSYLVPGIVGTWAKSQGEAVTLALEITHRGGF